MTITQTRPTVSRAQLERAATLVATLLKGRGRKDGTPAAAGALGRALGATQPKSEHGQLLFRTLRSLQADAGGKPRADDERAVWWLACRGQTPSPAAVAGRIRAVESARSTAAAVRAAVAAIAEHDGPKAAAYVADMLARDGTGPTWRELADAMDWPRIPYEIRFVAVTRLVHAGWLETGEAERSLRPGRKAGRR
jgi:hypothetical protein